MNRSPRTTSKFSRGRVLGSIGVAIGIVALAGGYGIVHKHAAENHAEQITATGNISAAPNLLTSASNSAAVSPMLTAYPSYVNAGFMKAPGYTGTLKNCGRPAIKSNTTYKFCNFSNGLTIGSAGTHPVNVKFIGCRFASNSVEDADVADYGKNITFSYSTFEPSTVAISAEPKSPTAKAISAARAYEYGIDQRYKGTLTIDHSDFWGFSDAIQFSSSTKSAPLVVTNSWFHNPSLDPTHAQHVDGILDNNGGTSYVTFHHNTIVGNGNTQAIALQGSVPYNHLTITNNYLSGFGYTVSIGTHSMGNHITFVGNVLGSDIKPTYGYVYDYREFATRGLGNVWRKNTYYVAPGTKWLAAKNSKRFWWPRDMLPSSPTRAIGHLKDWTGP